MKKHRKHPPNPKLLAFTIIFTLIGGYIVTNSFAATPPQTSPATTTLATNTAATSASLSGDLNADNVVNIFDLSILLSHYGQSGQSASNGDLNSDGIINVFDLSILLSNYGKTSGGTATCAINTPNVPDGPDPWGGCFPGPSNTGVPAGTSLATWTDCKITSDMTIDAKTINCPGDLLIQAKVTITRSKINGHIVVDTDANQSWSLTLTDSEVAATAGDLPAIYNGNVTILRANISGGHNAMECQEHSSVCSMRDTYIHDQWQAPTGDTHLGGVAHFGEQVACLGAGSNGMTAVCMNVEHSSVICDAPVNSSGGGCTGDLNMIAHYGPITGAFIYRNLMGANVGASFCSYGGYAPENGGTRIVYLDNIFQRGSNNKCADNGPINAFQYNNAGNQWTNNKYDDGTEIICTAADECL